MAGFESDSAASKGHKGPHKQTRRRGKQSTSFNEGWDSLKIEDFIDTEFDFEANLALFDKQAFYHESDKRAGPNAMNGGRLRNLIPDGEQILVEGPDKIGFEPVSCK